MEKKEKEIHRGCRRGGGAGLYSRGSSLRFNTMEAVISMVVDI